MYGLPPAPSKGGGEKGGKELSFFLYISLSQYVKIFARRERLKLSFVVRETENQQPTTDNQNLKVVIAAGLTSSHPEQSS